MIYISTGSKSPDPVIWKSMFESLTDHLVAQTAWAPPSAAALPGTYGPMCLEGLPALLVTHVGQLYMSYMLTDLHIL